MTEAAIMLSFLAFVWTLMAYATFMANNTIRTATAARHAAWMKGNGHPNNAVESQIPPKFFEKSAFADVTRIQRRGLGQTPSLGAIMQVLVGDSYRVWQTDVRFGVDGVSEASAYPFVLMNADFPFMDESQVNSLLNISTGCQWAEIYDTWGGSSDLSETLDRILGLFNL